jgi:hypothetical protein
MSSIVVGARLCSSSLFVASNEANSSELESGFAQYRSAIAPLRIPLFDGDELPNDCSQYFPLDYFFNLFPAASEAMSHTGFR